ncbi:MAG TPA: GNAT family N-acetyltransferase [Ornithinibacter sp.]|nr:GNAT family N-acetyltransferase [Ornithinibacter sp.]
MTDPTAPDGHVVERVTAASWRTYRDVRLAALIDSPRAFWATYAEAAARTDDEWRERCATTGPTWLALDHGRPVGTVGLWHAPEQPVEQVYLVGMWVATVARGTGAATLLVGTALTHAAASGRRRVVLDVAHENTRARAFYVRMGFRPTGEVGAMPWDPSVTEETLALDLPVGA